MSITLVLAIGLDSSPHSTHGTLLRSAGFIEKSTNSIREALADFRTGDFDLVLLGPSISHEQKESLAAQIRALGSRTPIVCITNSLSDHASFADATLNTDTTTLLDGLRELVAKTVRVRSTRSIAFSNAY